MGTAAEPNAEALRLFSEYVAALEQGPLDFESWVTARPEHERELRGMHAAWQRARAFLPDSPARVPAADTGAGESQAGLGASLEGGLEVLEELGRGSFGAVYRARDRLLDRSVALKVMARDARLAEGAQRRFLEEARVLAKIDHPNVVRIYAVDAREGEIRLVLELVKGRTLADIVHEGGPLGWDEAARTGAEVARALAALHAQNLMHLDVKAGNVMRAEGGRIVLLDFGLARAGAAMVDHYEPLVGTPLAMAPEQLAGEPVGPRADLYALGVMLYWLVSGRYPHAAQTFSELRERVLSTDPTPLVDVRADVPAAFAAVIERALRRDPLERWSSAGEMEQALRGLLAERPGTQPRPRWLPWGLLGAAAAAIAALALLVPRRGQMLASDGLEVEAQLYARRAGGDVRLHTGDTVHLGDDLFLEIRSSEDVHLYVFNEDEAGGLYQLHPLEELGLANPVHAGESQRLPRAPDNWRVSTSGGGAEHILVMASASPSPIGLQLCAEIPDAVRMDTLERAVTYAEIRSGLRGIGGVVAAPLTEEIAELDALSELFLRLEGATRGDPGVRLERFELRHPD